MWRSVADRPRRLRGTSVTGQPITKSRHLAVRPSRRLPGNFGGRRIAALHNNDPAEATPMQTKSEIDQLLRRKCDAKEIPGVVAMAATGSETIYQGAFGKRDLTKDDAMTVDSVFWIASMTKAITTAAGMQMVEQGKL